MGLLLKFQGQNKCQHRNIFLINVHLPATRAKDPNDEAFSNSLDLLTSLLEKCPKDAIPLIGGDFNARLGTRQDYDCDLYPAIGPYGMPATNSRGNALASFLQSNALRSQSSFFRKETYHTWCNPRKSVHQLDYFLTRSEDSQYVLDCGTHSMHSCPSDHLALKIKLSLPDAPSPTSKSFARKPSFHDHYIPEHKKHRVTLDQDFNRLVETEIAKHDDHVKLFSTGEIGDILLECASKVYPTKLSRKPWFEASSTTILPLIELRNKAEQRYLKFPTEENLIFRSRARSQLKRVVKQAKINWLEQIASDLSNMKNSPVLAWQQAKKLIKGFNGH